MMQSVLTLIVLVAGFAGYLVNGTPEEGKGARTATVSPAAEEVAVQSGAAAPALRYSPGDDRRAGGDIEAAAIARDSVPLDGMKVCGTVGVRGLE